MGAIEAVLPSEEQAEVIDFIAELEQRGRTTAAEPLARLVDASGRGVPVPASMFGVLVEVAHALRDGLAVTVAPRHMTLSTQEAADLLKVSRTTLVRLLESGEIPFEKPSRHRKIQLVDLLEYARRQRRAAAEALDDMVSDAERMGLYDLGAEEISQALRAARKSD